MPWYTMIEPMYCGMNRAKRVPNEKNSHSKIHFYPLAP